MRHSGCEGFVAIARAAAVDAGTLDTSGPTSGARTVMTAATADLDRLHVWWSEWAVNPACDFTGVGRAREGFVHGRPVLGRGGARL